MLVLLPYYLDVSDPFLAGEKTELKREPFLVVGEFGDKGTSSLLKQRKKALEQRRQEILPGILILENLWP